VTVSHSATLRIGFANDVLAAIDAGVGVGNLVLRTAANVEVATLPLAAPAGVVSGALLTFGTITSDAAATGGIVAICTLEDSDGNVALTGTVALSGGDLNMSSLDIEAGANVSVSFLSYTAPA